MFVLHPQLQKDTLFIGNYPLCAVLLMNDHRFPWIILVPRLTNIIEITDLSEAEFRQFNQEMWQSFKIMQSLCQPYKMNSAALGNKVSQYHFHIIARFPTDAAWPNPVWGAAPLPYPKNSPVLHAYKEAFDRANQGFMKE